MGVVIDSSEDLGGKPINDKALLLRLSALTAIIMGEGLNGICVTLHQALGSLGRTPRTLANTIAVMLTLYFLWLLYFDGKPLKPYLKFSNMPTLTYRRLSGFPG